MWNYEKIGNEIAMKMISIDGIREPTLSQIQENADKSVCGDQKFLSVPAWMYYSEPHPGLPEHYHTINSYINNCITASSNDNNLQLPQLPFSMVNREIKYKLLIALKASQLKIPSLESLVNGSIVISSCGFSSMDHHEIETETEIFMDLHDKLLPCCFTTTTDDVIIDSPATTGSRVRCYYLVIPAAVSEVTFMDSNGNVICRCDYQEVWLHGSTSYRHISKALRE